jgi:hypothetical protein
MIAKKSNSGVSDKVTELKQTRISQLSRIKEIIAVIETSLKKASGYQKRQLNLLESVSLGLYDEIDKLAKKAPAEPVTDLVLNQMNDVIKETKELVIDDSYIQRLQEFVAAGDNPQHRDSVVVLRQIRQGLDRFQEKLDDLISKLNWKCTQAKDLEKGLQHYVDGNESISAQYSQNYDIQLPSSLGNYTEEGGFDFSQVDKFINTYVDESDIDE